MQLNDAIKLRLETIMKEKHINSRYKLSCLAGLNPSSLNDFYRNKTFYPRIDTIYLLCESLGISLEEFFNDPLFNIENIEVQKDSK